MNEPCTEQNVLRDRDIAGRLSDEMAVIAKIGRLMSSSLDINDVYERFAADVQQLIPFDRLAVNLCHHRDAVVEIAYVSGADVSAKQKGEIFPLAGSVAETTLRMGTGLLFNPASVEDVAEHFPALLGSYHKGMRSMMTVPLISRNQLIGTLSLRSRKPNLYTGQDLSLAERIGMQIAGAIANARLFADLKRDEKEKTLLARLGRVIGSTLDIDEVHRLFAAEVASVIPYDRLLINLKQPPPNEDRFLFTFIAGTPGPKSQVGGTYPIEGSMTETVLKSRTGMLVQPRDEEEIQGLYPRQSDSYRAGMRSTIIVPLLFKDDVIGVIIFRSQQANAYKENDLLLAERIGIQIAGAIANARLFTDLKTAEKSLQVSETRFRSIFNQAAVGVAEVDTRTRRFITVNRRLCELVGMTEEELLATALHQMTHPDDLHVHEEGMGELKAGMIGEFTMEKRYRKKDGAMIWVNMTMSPLGKPGEESGRYIAVIQDITERKRAQQESENHARQMTALHATGLQLMAELNLDELLRSIAQHALNVIGGTCCNFLLYRTAEDLLERIAKAGAADIIPNISHRRGVGFIGHIWETQTPLLVNDYNSWPQRIKEHEAFPPRALVGTPILWDGEMLGVLSLMALLPHQYTQADAEVLDMLAMQAAIAIHNAGLYDQRKKNIAEREKAEEILKSTLDQLESRVQERTIELEEINTALKVLLKKGGTDQRKLEESVQCNIDELVMPFLHKLKVNLSDKGNLAYLNILETNLNHIVSPFINQLSATFKSLTPKEIQIAELIKQGKSSKDIAELFGLSVGTVVTHRNNIRKKMRLTSKSANLRSHLLFLS